MDLVVAIYLLTKEFPKEEMYGLTSQMRLSAVSIPSNIAEGRRRGSRKDFQQFIIIAYISGAELETPIDIAKRLSFGQKTNLDNADRILDEVMRMLNKISTQLTN